MKLPAMTIEFIGEDGLVEGFRLAEPSLVADPLKLSSVERTISLLFSYRAVMRAMIDRVAPTTAKAILEGEYAND